MTPEEKQLERLRGYLERRPRLGPETVHIDVTNGCNLECITCWSYAPTLTTPKPASWKRERIDAAFFFRVLNEVHAAGADRIVISGAGDPFTHPDIERFLAAVKEKSLRLTLITNGTLCNFETLKALRVDQVLLNTASATPETYVAYHPGQPLQTFHRLMDGVKLLRGVTAVNLVQVINSVNAHELVQMVELAANVGARVSYKLGDTPSGTERYRLTDDQKRLVLDELIPAARVKAKQLGVKHNLDAYENHLRGTKTTPPPCFAGYLYSRVSLDGRVSFCCAPIDAGHLNDGSFSTVWSAPSYDAVRARLHDGKPYDPCARCGKHDMNFAAARDLQELRDEGLLA